MNLVYIDPPYNTGEENWRYNDNVNSPEVRRWLDEVVGKEGEDLSRHDKWLCMMYPRLSLLKDLMAGNGVIAMSIDDNEVAAARMLLDELFSPAGFIASVVWQRRTSPDARKNLSAGHDYILFYGKHPSRSRQRLNKISLSAERASEYKNPDHDPRGPWASVDLTGQSGHATADQFFKIVTPSGRVLTPPAGRCWALAERTYLQLLADQRIWFGKNGTAKPRQKRFLSEAGSTTAWTWWPNDEVGHTQEATQEVAEILGKSGLFETPKPMRLMH